MNEIHTLLSLDKPVGEYYKGGRSLLPTKSASSSSAFSHMILALRGERAELCPVNPIPLEVCYNMSQYPLCKLPDTRIFHINASSQHILWNLHHTWVWPHSSDTQMQSNIWKLSTQPGFEPGTFLCCKGCCNTELLDWADALAKISQCPEPQPEFALGWWAVRGF